MNVVTIFIIVLKKKLHYYYYEIKYLNFLLQNFLYRRLKFFTGYFYRYNEVYDNLGSTAIEQMINEAKSFTN